MLIIKYFILYSIMFNIIPLRRLRNSSRVTPKLKHRNIWQFDQPIPVKNPFTPVLIGGGFGCLYELYLNFYKFATDDLPCSLWLGFFDGFNSAGNYSKSSFTGSNVMANILRVPMLWPIFFGFTTGQIQFGEDNSLFNSE